MDRKLTTSTVFLLLVPPFLWAGNAVVGRAVHQLVSPLTFNFLRFGIALIILLPLGYCAFRPGSGLWKNRRRYLVLGLLGVGLYNSLQYLALHTSTPINVTLVSSSLPLWTLLIGLMFFNTKIAPRQVAGALMSVAGVLTVLSTGHLQQLFSLRFVAGDLFMIIATVVWAGYSWLLIHGEDSPALRSNWAAFLVAQISFGVGWSAMLAAGEWAVTPAYVSWGWPLAAALMYVAVGPAIIAFRCWGAGVQRVGPTAAGFFANLTPLFAAIMSSAFLGEPPRAYHAVAFALIVGGIVLSSRR